ncbi:MAG: hypothetical protein COV70_02465 [Parcubacteria group bacterium CG11_big_fil_rev_8_21_14_0_20_39_22]|nr:MAG: hypothetical protein COV70_02465 [Parcubacteria group bacterium CG11_big_fil_rev_8_21_14_0_20_39_22]
MILKILFILSLWFQDYYFLLKTILLSNQRSNPLFSQQNDCGQSKKPGHEVRAFENDLPGLSRKIFT